jgi:hypothetical protein
LSSLIRVLDNWDDCCDNACLSRISRKKFFN